MLFSPSQRILESFTSYKHRMIKIKTFLEFSFNSVRVNLIE